MLKAPVGQGRGQTEHPRTNVWLMASQWLWTQVADMGPSRRDSPTIAWHPKGDAVVLYGGLVGGAGAQVPVGDTWKWDGQHWAQVQDSGPYERHGVLLAEARGGDLLLFGGLVGAKPLQDTWLWDGDHWTQVADSGPTWSEPTMAYDPEQDVTVLVDQPRSTWHWDGSFWTEVHDSSPVLGGRRLVWDIPTKQMVMVGRPSGVASSIASYVWTQLMWAPVSDMGQTGDVLAAFSSPRGAILRSSNGTWLWEGSKRRWTQVQDMGGRFDTSAAGTWDPSRGCGVLFAGNSGRTWLVTPPKA